MHDQQFIQKRIVIDPNVMVGKPVIRGTRIPVALIVQMLGQGIKEQTILDEHPNLAEADIRAALFYAANSLSDQASSV